MLSFPLFQETLISHLTFPAKELNLIHSLAILECLPVTWNLNLELLFISRALNKQNKLLKVCIWLAPCIHREATPSVPFCVLVCTACPMRRVAGITGFFFGFWRHMCQWDNAQLWKVKMQISPEAWRFMCFRFDKPQYCRKNSKQ